MGNFRSHFIRSLVLADHYNHYAQIKHKYIMISYILQFKALSSISTKFKLISDDKLAFESLDENLFKAIIYFDEIYSQFVILYQIINSGGEILKPELIGNPLQQRIAVEFYQNQLYYKLLPCGIEKQLDLIEYLSLARRELDVDLLEGIDIQTYYAELDLSSS